MSEVTAYLTLAGNEFDPNIVSKALFVPATEIRRKDEILGNGRCFGHDEWTYCTGTVITEDISEVLKSIVSSFSHLAPSMNRVAKTFHADWSILIHISARGDRLPVLFLQQDVIHFASMINAEIGFDLYL